MSTNGTRWPAATTNSAAVVRPRPSRATGACKRRASGPATALMPSSVRRTHGTTEPYSKRITNSVCIVTLPRKPSTTRTRFGAVSRTGMKSVTATAPSAVSCSVRKTRVLSV